MEQYNSSLQWQVQWKGAWTRTEGAASMGLWLGKEERGLLAPICCL